MVTDAKQTESCIAARGKSPRRAVFSERLIAAVFDIILLSLLIRASNFAIGKLLPAGTSATYFAMYIIPLLLTLGYFALFAWSRNGQTIAKGWLRIKVVDLQGRRPSWPRFLLREFLARGVIILSYGWLGSYSLLWYLTYLLALSRKRRALHDVLAGTQVIRINRRNSL